MCRDYRNNRAALFDGIEEGGIRASASYSSHEIDEHDNERAVDGLQDRVILLKRVSFIFPCKLNRPSVVEVPWLECALLYGQRMD